MTNAVQKPLSNLIELYAAFLRDADGRITNSFYSLKRAGDAKGVAVDSLQKYMNGITETLGLKALPLTEVSLERVLNHSERKQLSVCYFAGIATGSYICIEKQSFWLLKG